MDHDILPLEHGMLPYANQSALMILKIKSGCVAVFAVLLATASNSVFAQPEPAYGYCIARLKAPTGKIHYLVSDAFRHKAGVYHVGVENSFTSHVDAHSRAAWDGWTLCNIDYDSWQEATDLRNETVADYRRDAPRTSVSTTAWSYRGD